MIVVEVNHLRRKDGFYAFTIAFGGSNVLFERF